jgi:hypothetical protein
MAILCCHGEQLVFVMDAWLTGHMLSTRHVAVIATKTIARGLKHNHLVGIVLHNIAASLDDETQASNDPSRHVTFAGFGGFRVPRALNTSLCVVFGGLIDELDPMHGLFRGD